MTTEDFSNQFDNFKSTAFRLQVLPVYSVAEIADDYARFRLGAPFPDRTQDPWIQTIAEYSSAGKHLINVHLIPESLTDYLRYAIDWWYVYWDQAGANVRFLLNDPMTAQAVKDAGDFWMFDDTIAFRMVYDGEGEFLRAEQVNDSSQLQSLKAAKELTLAHSIPLKDLLALRRAGKLT